MKWVGVAMVLILGACSGGPGGARLPAGPGSLSADPPGLGFDCVVPGCRQERVLRLVSEGPGPVRIYSLDLEEGSSGDFQRRLVEPPPWDLLPGAESTVAVSYVPTDARVDTGALLIEYGSPEGPDPTTRDKLRVALQVRLFGIPAAEVTPRLLSFGYVAVGERSTLEVTVRNRGTGNALLEVPSASLREGAFFSVSPAVPPPLVLGPLQEQKLAVTYVPAAEGVHVDRLVVHTSDPAAEEVEVLLRGTSVVGPRASLEPAGPFPLGDVRLGGTREQLLRVSNAGSDPLEFEGIGFTGSGAGHFQVSPPASSIRPVAPFESVMLTVTYAPTAPGVHSATLIVATNDPVSEALRAEFTGRGINPTLAVSPTSIEWGRVVAGWTRGPTPIVASNEGFGPLRIERVFLLPGSSPEIELGTLPGLPIVLNQGNHFEFEVRYVARSIAPVQARLRVESDDPQHPGIEVAVSGEGVTCEVGCAMQHATPRCDSGACEIRACEVGYYNTDGVTSTGCECRIESPEPSGFCSEASFLGTLVDSDGNTFTVQGQLHHAGDVDWYNFFAFDEGGIGQLFSDSYDVRITLTSPPGQSYKMCVFRVKRGAHESVCPPGADQPCSAVTSYRDDGTYGSDDSSDYFIKVWTDGPRTSCGTYTLTMKNG
jgi:hypothetical protein